MVLAWIVFHSLVAVFLHPVLIAVAWGFAVVQSQLNARS